MGSIDEGVHLNEAHPSVKTSTIIEVANDVSQSAIEDTKKQQPEWVYPHPTNFTISEHPIDEVKALKVITPHEQKRTTTNNGDTRSR